eukprot:271494_1
MSLNELKSFSSTNSYILEALQHEICNRAKSKLQHILEQESYLLRSIFRDKGMSPTHTKFDDGLHLYFTCRNVTEIPHYLQLYLVDQTMDMLLLLHIRTNYDLQRSIIADKWLNISHRTNKIRSYLIRRNNECHCVDSELIRKFDLIMHKHKYIQLLSAWNEIKQLISADAVLIPMWDDMIYVIKKDIIKILMHDKNNNYGIEYYYNDIWILFIDELLMSYENSVMDLAQYWFKQITLRLLRFGEIVTDLFNEIKMENNYTLLHDLVSHDLATFNKSMVSVKWTVHIAFMFQELWTCVTKMDNNIGLSNKLYFRIIMEFTHLRSLVLIYPNINEEKCRNVQLLSNIKHEVMWQLYNRNNSRLHR